MVDAKNPIGSEYQLLQLAVPYEPFDSIYNLVDCIGGWVTYSGNSVPIPFQDVWVTYSGDTVPIPFTCQFVPPTTFFSALDSYSGEVSLLSINTFVLLGTASAWSGEYTVTDLEIPTIDLELVLGYSGEYADSGMSNFPRFLGLGYSGEYADSSMYVLHAIDLEELPNRSGEETSSAIEIYIQFDLYNRSGEFSDLDFEINPAWRPDLYHWSGEFADSILNTSLALELFTYSGEYSNSDLTINAQWNPDLPAYAGEYGYSSLRTIDTLFGFSYSGELGISDLEIFPQASMLIDGHSGESSTTAIQTSEKLGIFEGKSAEVAYIPEMVDDPDYRNKSGEFCDSDLSTEMVFDFLANSGEVQIVDVYDRPSEGIGIVRAYSGEFADSELFLLRTALLYPNVISTGQSGRFIFPGQWFIGDIDLQNISCCPRNLGYSITRIEMSQAPELDERYDGEKWPVVTVELLTAPRFKFNSYTGESTRTPDALTLSSNPDAYSGELSFFKFEPQDVKVKLCIGNFIPDGGNIIFEMTTPYQDGCEDTVLISGESLKVSISTQQALKLDMYTGENTYNDIVLTPIMLFYAWSGEHARTMNPEMEFIARTGENYVFNLYEPHWYAYVGETTLDINLITDYEVDFEEVGCLDNEYVPSDEDGDPDYAAAREVPVELDNFRHSIKVKCF